MTLKIMIYLKKIYLFTFQMFCLGLLYTLCFRRSFTKDKRYSMILSLFVFKSKFIGSCFFFVFFYSRITSVTNQKHKSTKHEKNEINMVSFVPTFTPTHSFYINIKYCNDYHFTSLKITMVVMSLNRRVVFFFFCYKLQKKLHFLTVYLDY